MTLKLLIFGCLVATSLVAATRYGVSRGRQDGFGGHGGHGGNGGFGDHGGHGGGFGGHGGGFGGHGHPPPHGFGPGGHGGFHGPPHDHGHDHRPPPHGFHHGHDHWHDLKNPPHGHEHGHPQEPQKPDPQEPKQPQKPEPKEPQPEPEPKHPQEPHPQTPDIEVNFIIYEPDGLDAWIVQQKDVVFFGIEVYVNIDPSKVVDAKCDVCTNTTVITNGKLIIEDVDVVVKKGDVLYYYALIGNGHSIVRQKLRIVHVTESHIGKCNCPDTSNPDIDIRFNEDGPKTTQKRQYIEFREPVVESVNDIFGTTERPADPVDQKCSGVASSEICSRSDEIEGSQREVLVLERIVEFMRASCGGAKTTNKLVLQKQAPVEATGETDLEKFVKSYFVVSLELQKLGRAIRRVTPAGQGIEFEMDNYVDKQRTLHYTRTNILEGIVDPDLTEDVMLM